MGHILETIHQIWDNSSDERIEVGPDRDGLGLIEIRHVSKDGAIGNRIVLEDEQVPLLIEALGLLMQRRK